MTHETKAGIAVSVAFLCLVSTLVATKLRDPQAHAAGTATEADPQVAQSPPPPVPLEPTPAATLPPVTAHDPNTNAPAPAPAALPTTGNTLLLNHADTTPSPAAATSPAPATPAPAAASTAAPVADQWVIPGTNTNTTPAAVPAPANSPATPAERLQQEIAGQQPPAPSPSPGSSAAPPSGLNLQSLLDNATGSANPPSSPTAAASAPANAASSPSAPPPFPSGLTSPSPVGNSAPAPQPSKEPAAPAALTPAPLPFNGSTTPKPVERPVPATPSPTSEPPSPPPFPQSNTNLVAPSSASSTSPAPFTVPGATPSGNSVTAPPAPAPNMPSASSIPPIPSPTPAVSSVGAPPAPVSSTQNAGLGATAATSTPITTPALVGNTDNAPRAPAPAPVAPASFNAADPRPLPPVGAPPNAGTPAIAPAAAPRVAPTQPLVEAYDEVTYRTKAGDTFESIAKEKYESEKYGKALLLFNRNHFRPAEGIGQEPPRLQAGQPVYIPPVYILERHYASAIPGFDPVTAAPSAATLAPPASALSQKAPAGEAQPAKAYRVRPGDEMIRDIAKRTLGDPDRWWDIGQLNPQYNPAYPLKAGTVLRMPASAQIEATDVPQS